MFLIISKHFYFLSMSAKIRNFYASCETCIMNKSRRSRRSGKLGILGPPSATFRIISLDTIGGFGNRKSSKTYLLLLLLPTFYVQGDSQLVR